MAVRPGERRPHRRAPAAPRYGASAAVPVPRPGRASLRSRPWTDDSVALSREEFSPVAGRFFTDETHCTLSIALYTCTLQCALYTPVTLNTALYTYYQAL